MNLSPEIWTDDNKLRAAFSWLTRLGIAPKAGSLPVHYYQQDQVKAIESIEALCNAVGGDLTQLRSKAGCYLETRVAGKWVRFARYHYSAIGPWL
jgi:hypothetical protein